MAIGMTGQTDEAIAALVQNGDHAKFGELVERYQDKLMRYAKRFLFQEDEAKDLVQEVFLKAYQNIRSFDPSRKFSSWIYRIAHNEFINAIKKKQGRMTFSLFDFDVLFPHPLASQTAEGEAERNETKALLEKQLSALHPKYREPLVLYYFEEMDYKEISEVLGIPVSTVGVRLRRGKLMLQKKWKSQ